MGRQPAALDDHRRGQGGSRPIGPAELDKIGVLHGIEAEVRSQSVDTRRAVRQERARPLVDALQIWPGE